MILPTKMSICIFEGTEKKICRKSKIANLQSVKVIQVARQTLRSLPNHSQSQTTMSTRTSLFSRSSQLRVFHCPYRHHPRFSFSSAFLTTRATQPWSPHASPFTTTIRRPYSVQLAHPTPVPTLLLSSPTPEQIEEEEIDVDLPPLKDIRIALTDRAAEVSRLVTSINHRQILNLYGNGLLSATTSYCCARKEPRRSFTHIRGVWWMPWISIQIRACEDSRNR